MSKWSFFGRVLPERIPITRPTPLEGSTEQPSLGFSYTYRVTIHQSQIVADMKVTKGSPDVYSIRNAAVECIRMITDLIGYQHGCYFDVEILSAVSQETSDWQVFANEIRVLASRRMRQTAGVIDGRLV